jgi:hypothetical protein
MSKDQTKTVIESEELSEETQVVVKGKRVKVKKMTLSQWMKGCPEGGEQSVSRKEVVAIVGTRFN